MYFQLLHLLLVSWLTSVVCQDFSCIAPKPLLEGRRRFDGVVFRTRNYRSGYPATEARISGGGWCSGQQGENVFDDPFLEVDFGDQDVIFDSVATQGFSITLFTTVFTERYQIEIAGQGRHFQHIATPTNSTYQNPAVFPLGERIVSDSKHKETLPRSFVGHLLRINPYEWNNEDNACTKLEVYGCPLLECHTESRLTATPGVNSVMIGSSQMSHGSLFNFDDTEVFYCAPTNQGKPTITIRFRTSVLLTEIGIHGNDRFIFSDHHVTRFSLSYENDGNFTEYIRQTGVTMFNVADHDQHFFGLWPPINTTSIKFTINGWNGEPCLSLLLLGCGADNVVDHSVAIDNTTANAGLVDDVSVTLTTTELVTTTHMATQLVTITQTVASTVLVTVTANVSSSPLTMQNSSSTMNPSPMQTSSASSSCSSKEKDNTPIYVTVVIVVVGLLVAVILVIVGVILCHYQQQKVSSVRSKSPIIAAYKSADSGSIVVEVSNDLYGREPGSQASPNEDRKDDNSQVQIYEEITKQHGEMESAINPQYGETIKPTTKNNETVYSYAVP
ncbi:mucin-3B-like [Dysidea avara]|uniref:mucin-3B-like n=1 Tax=Dysidea avara TaxID=196820 RepID=UPI00331BD605